MARRSHRSRSRNAGRRRRCCSPAITRAVRPIRGHVTPSRTYLAPYCSRRSRLRRRTTRPARIPCPGRRFCTRCAAPSLAPDADAIRRICAVASRTRRASHRARARARRTGANGSTRNGAGGSSAPETQAKVEAQETDNFNKFFAPPPAPPQPADSESPTNTQENRTAPQTGRTNMKLATEIPNRRHIRNPHRLSHIRADRACCPRILLRHTLRKAVRQSPAPTNHLPETMLTSRATPTRS